MIGIGHWMLKFGDWNFQERRFNNYTYSVGDVDKKGDFLNSTNDVIVNLKTGNMTWENKTPCYVVFANNGAVERRYMGFDSDFCVFIIDNR